MGEWFDPSAWQPDVEWAEEADADSPTVYVDDDADEDLAGVIFGPDDEPLMAVWRPTFPFGFQAP